MKRMFPVILLLSVIMPFLLAQNTLAANEKLIGARFPAISPDGSQIAFSYLGDLWIVSSEGGKAYRLTDHKAYEREPVWSPDGKWLAFTSNRYNNNDVFVMPATGGEPIRLTFHSGNDVATDFSPDGKWVIFQSSRSSMSSLFKIPVKGGNVQPILDTYWSWTYHGKISPDGNTILFSLGMENNFWWRRGYAGSNSSKIWTKDLSANQAKKLVDDPSNSFWADWSPDGQTVYFVNDRDYSCDNIWKMAISGGDMQAVTKFREGDVRWMSLARKKPVAAFERKFGIWLTDLTSGESHEVQIDAPAEIKSNSSFFAENESVREYRLSPDGKKIAAVVRGEIFVLSTEGGYARNITHTPWRERDIDWDKESKNLVYVSDVDANPDLYFISALGTGKPVKLTSSEEDELDPKFSPDGKWIAYYRGKRQIRLIQPDGKNDRLVYEADFGGRFADDFSWSPDSRFLGVAVQNNANQDIFAVDVQSGEQHALTNTAYDESSPMWSLDGKFMLFTSNRFGHSFPEFTGKWDIYQVYFKPQPPKFDEDKFEKLFTAKKEDQKKSKKEGEEKKEEKPKPEISFKLDDLDLQTRSVTNTLGNDTEFVLSPKDTSTVYFVSNIDGKRHLWQTSLKDDERGKYEPFMAKITNPRSLQFDEKGNNLYYLSNGKIGKIEVSGNKNKSISFKTKIEVEKTADYEQMLAELYYTLQYYYYDANHHQVNWKEVYQQFRPVLQQVREDQDFYDYANEMIGYLNSSHTGIRSPRADQPELPSAHVGAEWQFSGEKVILRRIINNSPLYMHRDSVSSGDVLLAVNGEAVDGNQNIWKYLNGKLGKRVTLTFKSQALGKNIEVSVEPISGGAENHLLLEEWIDSRKEIVKQRTDDQVAYIYMRAMGRNDLERFLKELQRDAVPRKGLILDLRYNFGGNVHDRVLQALTTPVYAKWRIRGLSETQQSTFGFADKPIVLLTNEVTLSDGEMTTNGFKTLDRGTVVGNTTYGWLIFTTSVRLMNGGSFRLPFWGCYTINGQDLETIGGIQPDIPVINDLNNDLQQQDAQLDKAIQVILEKVEQ